MKQKSRFENFRNIGYQYRLSVHAQPIYRHRPQKSHIGQSLVIMSLTKSPKSETKNFFFITDSKTCQIFWGFEQLSSGNRQRSYAIGKTTEICLILAQFPGTVHS